MRSLKTWIALLMVLSLAGCSKEGGSTVHPKKIKENAYQLLLQGDWHEAVILYEKLGYLGSQELEVVFNLGVSYYRAQHFGSALLSFERALKLSVDDPAMQARILHNIGNTLVWRARVLGEENRKQALELLRDAARCYRSSLALLSDQEDTRENLDLTEQWITRLESHDEESQATNNQESGQPQDSQPDEGEGGATDTSDGKQGQAGAPSEEQKNSRQQSGSTGNQAAQAGASAGERTGETSSGIYSQISMEEALRLIESKSLSPKKLDLSTIEAGSPSPGEPQW
jgi:tetratricopeptide (TPR) repeat protein